ncbi:MAG: 1-deoxy-D-xylulose-5-phosphate reductoisomerase, partial [Saccharofermentanales bacterium]
MVRAISVLGSTGSIGMQTLEVAEHFGIKVAALSAHSSVDKLYEQILRFRPSLVSMADDKSASALDHMLGGRFPEVEIMSGQSGNLAVASFPGAE